MVKLLLLVSLNILIINYIKGKGKLQHFGKLYAHYSDKDDYFSDISSKNKRSKYELIKNAIEAGERPEISH